MNNLIECLLLLKSAMLMKGDSWMDFKVGVGKSDFADLRNSGDYYVDKTEIYKFLSSH